MSVFVFPFENGDATQKDLLGGKGANLSEMTKLGIPVPSGFTITTKACNEFYEKNQTIWKELEEEVFISLSELEKKTGKVFGGTENPLLVSVRSGAKVSMPGMMDTILNLGLNFDTVKALETSTKNPRFAWDSFRRFIQMYGNVVMQIPHEKFEEIVHLIKKETGKIQDTELTASDWQKVVESYFTMIPKEAGKEFPLDPKKQLLGAIHAVFESWNCDRAIFYRALNNIPHHFGTAVNVQMMVFGNLGETSGTGVCFTRDPSTGENIFYGEFLLNAQGEDVVAGIRTPLKISELQEQMPKIYEELLSVRTLLENHFGDMQDIEFTIENEKLFLLQTRTGKRSAQASVRIAVEMVESEKISKEEAVLRISDDVIETLLHPRLDPEEKKTKIPLCVGLPASPGGETGKIVFNAEDAIEAAKHEERVILVRTETSPEDISGMHAAKGILTACGGMTSHAAVVARGMGRPCVSGSSDLQIDEVRGILKIDELHLKKGDYITIDGSTGEVFEGKIEKIPPNTGEDFSKILEWSKQIKRLEVRTNADTPKDTQRAVDFGAEGIGLCRTEHMFFSKDRIVEVRKMILTENEAEQKEILKKIEAFQQKDFEEILKILDGKPLCVRLLDPPLHEFLPQNDYEIEELAVILQKTPQSMRERISHLHEVNPMMGHRGCRLLLTITGLLETQVRALCEAKKNIPNAKVEIMVPLISIFKEFTQLKKQIESVIQEYNFDILVGTMIETPRACIIADQISKEAQFFSFGTNDLTQMTFGFSRDDIGKFLPHYLQEEILNSDPFQVFDQEGVGELVKKVVEPLPKDFKTSVCGEHGGNGDSILFFDSIGLTTVSCSPFRVPVAIVAAARAFIINSRK